MCLIVVAILFAFLIILIEIFDSSDKKSDKASEKKDFIKNVVDYYHHQKPISLEDLQQLFDYVYPEFHVILTLDDLKICDMAIKANYYQKIYDYFEMIKKRSY